MRHLVTATWDDVPHLTQQQKDELWAAIPAHERDARSKGIPLLGSGLIFPVDETTIICDPFAIPAFWPQIGGIDFGWDHPTGAASLAHDRDTDTIFVTRDYRVRQATPIIHAAALKAWGKWLPWAWPHDGNNDTAAGENLKSQYDAQELNFLPERATFEDGSNSVEAGLMDMLDRMLTGRWKVFRTCSSWLEERRLYHRKDGKIVKERDDVISASRYALMMLRFAEVFRAGTLPQVDDGWIR